MAPAGSQALPGGLWDDQHMVCCGQCREGIETAATLKTAVARGPGNVSAAMW